MVDNDNDNNSDNYNNDIIPGSRNDGGFSFSHLWVGHGSETGLERTPGRQSIVNIYVLVIFGRHCH